MKAVLNEAGLTMDHVVKTTVLLRDINEFNDLNQVYAQYFTGKSPARAALQVSVLPHGAHVEIEAVTVF